MENKLKELKTKLQEIYDLEMMRSLLEWDQSTYMPPGGATARGRQMAILTRLRQERLGSPELGKLLDSLQSYGETLDPDSDDARLLVEARKEFERATKVPPDFAARFTEHTVQSYQTWTEARPNNDFESTLPMLEKTLELSREYSNYFPGYDHIADPLLELTDPGMKVDEVLSLFAELRSELVPLVESITAQEEIDDSCVRKHFSEKGQLDFGLQVITDYGYDFERGRQDKTHHPFMTKFSLGDVRITTRVSEDYLVDALFSTLHESGHAMYELGIKPEFEGTPLASGTSAGVHESQSRLWENLVGRSRGFWEHYYPKLQTTFRDQLKDVSLDEFYAAINKVSRSLIRVDADEVTYNLHVMIRFDLEAQLLEGTLELKDLPEAWHAHYESDLGVRAPDDRDGVLQDVHWYTYFIGGLFQGYTLGNIMSSSFYDAALKAHPEITGEIATGNFDTLHTWLRENIYQYGRKFTASELVKRTTGGALSIEPYMQYLKTKYGELYSL
ncbi:MAG: carboxypeptidase M32 [Chloroflexi bacterium]|nr:MAG: carboxypeptidase M32 [Chloroflexota bacterium]MBL1193648.1 carboxypeptidase M32 [Chloroflexota bacterium]NOH10940.1 carboxypeptidase M32 [Chloroflexota bacterium]